MLKASEIYLLNEALDGKDIYGLDKEAALRENLYSEVKALDSLKEKMILNLMQLMTIFRKTQRHRTRNGAMPLCLFWHSFLVSADYLPNTVFLIIKIC